MGAGTDASVQDRPSKRATRRRSPDTAQPSVSDESSTLVLSAYETSTGGGSANRVHALPSQCPSSHICVNQTTQTSSSANTARMVRLWIPAGTSTGTTASPCTWASLKSEPT